VLGIMQTTARGIIKIYETTNRIEKLKRGVARPIKLTKDMRETICGWVDECCSLSLRRLKERCLSELQVDVCEKTIDRALLAFNYTLKRMHLVPERRNNQRVIDTRAEYADQFMQMLSTLPSSQFIFLDKVGFSVSMRCRRGRSVQGTPAVQVIPSLCSMNTSVVCAMNLGT
jgi:transposase